MRLSLCLLTLPFSLILTAQGPAPAGPGAGGGATSPSPGAGSTAPRGGIGNTNPTVPGRSTIPGQDPNQRSPFPDMQQRPIFLSGKVVLDDGQPPPDSVTIERVCNGVARPEGYTDSKGRFSIELGRNTAMMADASTSGGLDEGTFGRSTPGGRSSGLGGMGNSRGINERDLMGCEIRAVLPGFRGEVVNLAGRRFMDNPDIGTMILRRLANVEGFTFSMTTAMAPKEAKKSYEKSTDLIKKKKYPEALAEIEKATAAYPKYAVAWFEQGRLYEMQKRPDDALNAFNSAIAADPKYVKPYVNLAYLHAQKKDWQKTLEISNKGVKLNPFEYPQLHYFSAVSSLNLGKLDEAEKAAREASKQDPKGLMPRIDQLLGVILAQKQDFKGAKESFANYLKKDPLSADAEQVRQQMARLDTATAPAAPAPAPAPREESTAPPVSTAPAPPPPPASVSVRSAWPSWASGISDLPPGTLSKALDPAALSKDVASTVYSIVTAGDASQLKPEGSSYLGAAVAVSNTTLVTNCDVMETSGTTGLYQNGKLVTSTVRLLKSKRSAGLCVLEVSGIRLQPVNGVRYAQDLGAGEKAYTVHAGELKEGTLSSTKTQGNIKLLQATTPVSQTTAGGGLFDSFGNLIGITTLRSQNAVIAIEEFYQ